MQLQLRFAYILRLAFCVSQLALNASGTTEPRASFAISKEIERYALDTAEKIRETAFAILSIPPDEQTLENTLEPWNQLCARLSQDLGTLNELSRLDASSSTTVSQVSDWLRAYLLEVSHCPELHQALANCSLNIAKKPGFGSPQHYIRARLAKNTSREPTYLCEIAEEVDRPATDCAVFSLKSEFLIEAQMSSLANKILSENADAVCVQEIAEDNAYDLYEILRRNYVYFVYVPSSLSSNSSSKSGILIAGKFQGDPLKILLAKSRGDRNHDRGGAAYEGGITGRWGDGNGIQWEGYVKAEAYDNRGNYVEGKVTQRDDGTGEAGVRGGHENNNK